MSDYLGDFYASDWEKGESLVNIHEEKIKEEKRVASLEYVRGYQEGYSQGLTDARMGRD